MLRRNQSKLCELFCTKTYRHTDRR